ncbi:MAG: hypothetical protein ACJ72Z_02820 [Pyrinomonadaceae bacterium]
MRSIKKRIALWHIVLIVGFVLIAAPIAAHVSTAVSAVAQDPQSSMDRHAVTAGVIGRIQQSKHRKAAVRVSVEPQDYYDRRRQYWEDRVDRRMQEMDEEEGGDDEKADAKDSKESKDSKKNKDSKASKEDDEEDFDQEADMYERRREYWRQQLDDEW